MIKSNGFTKPMEKHLMNFYQGVVLLPKFDNNSPSATRDKLDLPKSRDYEVMTSYLLRKRIQLNPLNEVYLCPNLMLLASP